MPAALSQSSNTTTNPPPVAAISGLEAWPAVSASNTSCMLPVRVPSGASIVP